MQLRIGTRGSRLALWQANHVSSELSAAGIESTLVLVRTTGDRRTDVPLAEIGGKGLFIKELEEALARDEIDLAVHSLKDVPWAMDESFRLGAFFARGDARDAWVHPRGLALADLEAGSLIGTSAPRRRAQLRHLFPRLRSIDLRGNVETRIARASDGTCDGIILASAGLHRLNRVADITSLFSIDEMVPAAGQGIVTAQTLVSRRDVCDALAKISDRESRVIAESERAVLAAFGPLLDCYSPVGVNARAEGSMIGITAFVSDEEGQRALRRSARGPLSHHQDVVQTLVADLKRSGAEELLDSHASSVRTGEKS